VRSSEADQAAIIAACRQFLAADLVETACLARAPGSSSYRVRLNDRQSVIVKLYFDNSSWKAAHERRIIQALSRDATIRTAALVGCGQIDESAAALITVDLGDLTLWRAVEENECLGHEALQLIGYLLAMFHNIDLGIARAGDEQLGYGIPLAKRVWQQLRILRHDRFAGLAACVEPALFRLVDLCRLPGDEVSCHGDLHPANVVLCRLEGGVLIPHLVDFEATVRGIPEYDLAKSLVTTSALGYSDRQILLDGYGDQRAIADELLHALVVFHAVDGWIYAAVFEERNQALWRSRIDEVLVRYAPLFG